MVDVFFTTDDKIVELQNENAVKLTNIDIQLLELLVWYIHCLFFRNFVWNLISIGSHFINISWLVLWVADKKETWKPAEKSIQKAHIKMFWWTFQNCVFTQLSQLVLVNIKHAGHLRQVISQNFIEGSETEFSERKIIYTKLTWWDQILRHFHIFLESKP